MNLPIQEINGLRFYYRPGTTDEKVIVEVVKKQNYAHKNVFSVHPSDRWLDCGANIGTFTCLVAAHGCMVSAYEPEPECFAMLEANVKLNRLEKLVELNCAAVMATSGAQNLYLSKGNNKYRHTTFQVRGRTYTQIHSNAFAQVLNAHNFTAVKMDIEGAELAILDSMPEWRKVKKLAFEYHFDFDRSIANFIKRTTNLKETFGIFYLPKMPENKTTFDFFPSGKTVHFAKQTVIQL